MFLVLEFISQLPFSKHLYFSGSRSRMLRLKKPYLKMYLFHKINFLKLEERQALTLQPSHVIAPK